MPEPKENTTRPIPLVKFVCPLCKSDRAIYENNIVHVRLRVTEWNTDPEDVSFGEPADFAYPWSEIDGTIRTAEPSEAPRWYCRDCGAEFHQLDEIPLPAPVIDGAA